MTEHAQNLDVTEARQGLRGRHALIILVVSLTLGLIAVFGAWAYYSGDLAGKRASREAPPAVANSVTTTPSTPKQTD